MTAIPEMFMKHYGELIDGVCDAQLREVDELIAREDERQLQLIKERDEFQNRLKTVLSGGGVQKLHDQQ